MLFDLSGCVVVVTGALGQLGREYTAAIIGSGGRVVAIDVSIPDAPEFPVDKVLYIKCDITKRTEIEAALTQISAHWEVPYGLINNAAIDSPPDAPASENGAFETYPESSWDKIMEVNVKGAMLCSQVFGGAMAKAGRGNIINISSIYGIVSPDQSIYQYRRDHGEVFFKPVAYSVSKSALFNLTRYLASYWAKTGVRVNTLVIAGVFRNQEQQFLDAYNARMPVGRMAKSSEYNGTIIYMLSTASEYMTGSTITIDGGWTCI